MFIVALAYAGVEEAVITKLFSTIIIHCLAHSNLKERENVLLYLSHLPRPHAVMHWRRKLTNQGKIWYFHSSQYQWKFSVIDFFKEILHRLELFFISIHVWFPCFIIQNIPLFLVILAWYCLTMLFGKLEVEDFFLCVNEYEIKLQYVVGKFFFYICKTPKCDNALWNKSIFTLKTCIEHEIITDVK